MALRDTLHALGASLWPPDPRSPREIDDEVRAELEAHLAMRTEDNVAAGMSPAAARRDAESRFGDFEAIARACRAPWTGGRTMLQRFHLVISIVLVLALGAMLLQNRRLAAMQLEAANAAMARAEEALRAERELLERYQPEGELVFAVGDVLEVRDLAGYLDRSIEVVQPDGKLLLPDIGWFDVAGKTRTEVEAAIREAYVPYYSEPIDVKLVVREE